MKGLVTQAEVYDNPCKICHWFKHINTMYGHLPPKNIVELKPWYSLNVDLIGPYIKSIIQQHTGGAIIKSDVCLSCITMIDFKKG